MRRLVVIGGGIAGLAAAWAARQAAATVSGGLEVLLLERDPDVGGKARTVTPGDWVVEAGPTGFQSGTPEIDQLIAAAGLVDQVIPANAAAARRFIYLDGRMRRVSPNPVALVRSGLLSTRGCLRMLAEVGVPARRDDNDESVWEFARRRLGVEVADRMISPMALGVFAGDARRLSLQASFPRMAALEREHGSLIRGLIARKIRPGSAAVRGPMPELRSFRDGMQSLPHALAQRGGFQVRCNVAVRHLSRSGSGWQIGTSPDQEPIAADAIILATETGTTAALLHQHDAALAGLVNGISCPPVAVVALGYGRAMAPKVPRGFGVLIARGEGYRMLGNLWDSHLFGGRNPEGHLLIRAMYGGGVDPAAAELDLERLAALARREVAQFYGIDAPPTFEHTVRWPHAIPQYELGHPARVRQIDARARALPGVFLTGAGLRGVAFPAAATDGVQVGRAAAAWLSQS